MVIDYKQLIHRLQNEAWDALIIKGADADEVNAIFDKNDELVRRLLAWEIKEKLRKIPNNSDQT